MATEAEVRRLQQIRQRHADASTDWSLSSDYAKIFARIVPGTAPVALVETTADCDWPDRDFLLGAHDDIKFLLELLRVAFAEIRKLKPRYDLHPADRPPARDAKPRDYAAECAMKCGDRLFRRFLVECHNVPDDVTDADRIVISVRNILRVKSRGELNTDPAATARWLDFRASFEAWRANP